MASQTLHGDPPQTLAAAPDPTPPDSRVPPPDLDNTDPFLSAAAVHEPILTAASAADIEPILTAVVGDEQILTAADNKPILSGAAVEEPILTGAEPDPTVAFDEELDFSGDGVEESGFGAADEPDLGGTEHEELETGAAENRVSEPEFRAGEEPVFREADELDLPTADREEPEPGFGADESPPDKAEEITYSVGDFVWGKIKHHPWWPGRVYDPSQASERARNAHHRDNAMLVAYFGDDSFAWCEPSQLKPFTAAEFGEMSKQSNAKGFVNAVSDAVDAVGRFLQADLSCRCVPEEASGGLEVNGLVSVNSSISNYAPSEFLERLRDAACDALSCDMLDYMMICSWGLAFGKGSFSSGSFSYHPRMQIGELVDKIDIDALSLDLFGEEDGQDELWSPENRVVKDPEVSEKKPSRRRMRGTKKPVVDSDLIDADASSGKEEPEVSEKKLSHSRRMRSTKRPVSKSDLSDSDVSGGQKEPKVSEKKLSHSRRTRSTKKPVSKFDLSDSDASGGQKEPKVSEKKLSRSRTRSTKKPVSKFDLSDSDASSGEEEPEVSEKKPSRSRSRSTQKPVSKLDLSDSDASSDEEKTGSKRKKSGRKNAADSADRSGSGRRQRKKSKYLSPPYTDVNGNDKLPDSPMGTDSESPKMANEFSRSLLLDSSRILKEEEDNKSPVFKIDKTSATDILSEFLATAINPLNLKWNRSAKTVREFFAAYRSAKYTSNSELDDYFKDLDAGNYMDMPDDGKVNGKRKGVDNDGTTPHSEQLKAGSKRKTRKDSNNVAGLVDLNIQIADSPEGARSPHKRRKGEDHEPISSGEACKARQEKVKGNRVSVQKAPAELRPAGLKLNKKGNDGESSESLLETQRLEADKRRKMEATTHEGPTALLMTFAPGIALPTKEHLNTTFKRYGNLIESETDLANKSGCARVVFVKSTDAEKALNSRNKTKEFGSPVPSYRLCHLSGNMNSNSRPSPQIKSPKSPKPPLPSIKKGLQRMISTLSGSSSPDADAGSAEVLIPEVRENLVGDMKGLLTKVDKMLSPAAAAPSSALK